MMAEDTSTSVSDEDDIADVSLIDTPIEQAPDEPSTAEEEPKDDGSETTDEPAEESTEAKDTEATEPEAAQTDQTEAQKAAARQAYQERQRTKSQVAERLDQTFGPKTAEDLEEEGLDPREAQIQALREEMQYDKQRAAIAELNANMTHDSTLLLQDLPIYNPNSPEYDKEFTEMVDREYYQAARIQTAKLGDGSEVIVNAERPLYDYYKQMADIYSRGATKGSKQGQQDALQMMSRTEAVGGSSSGNTSGNSLEELEERLGDVVIT